MSLRTWIDREKEYEANRISFRSSRSSLMTCIPQRSADANHLLARRGGLFLGVPAFLKKALGTLRLWSFGQDPESKNEERQFDLEHTRDLGKTEDYR